MSLIELVAVPFHFIAPAMIAKPFAFYCDMLSPALNTGVKVIAARMCSKVHVFMPGTGGAVSAAFAHVIFRQSWDQQALLHHDRCKQ